ncbi:MAG: hypothetical protein L3J22_11455 [Xanthomonadales bacterium]|nr:hypothetical protein [Xanthomonadales bacterium]
MTNSEIKYINVWQNCPEKWQTATKDFWRILNILPDEAAFITRLEQLCTLAIDGDELIAVSTAFKVHYQPLRCDLYFFRCLVLPDYRRQSIARHLAVNCRDNLQHWVSDNPKKAAAGMATVVESPNLTDLSHQAVWPASGLNLVGYTQQGQQVRVVWFKDVLLD